MKNATGGTKAILIVLLCCLLISVGFNVWYLRNQSPSGYELSSCRAQLQSCQSQLTSLQSQVQSCQSQLSSLQNQLQSAEDQLSSLQTQLSSYQNQVSSLQSELSICQRHGKLQEVSVKADDKTINQGAGTRSAIVTFTAEYAGYVHVSGTSTTSNGYIMVTSSFGGYPHNDTRYSFGTGAARLIPVLPGDIVVYFGNTNLFGGATATITVHYVS